MSDTVIHRNLLSTGLAILYGLLGLSMLNGCGYKTMPIPPQEIVPKAITDLHYELDEKGVTLTWTYPSETVKGDTLSDIASFKLYRAVVPAEQYCDTCPIPFGEAIPVPGGAIAAGKPKKAVYKTTLLRPGNLFFFKVRSITGWWAESEDSNIVSFMWNIPPVAPQKITVQSLDSRIKLVWTPVNTHMDGTTIQEPVKYQIYRSQTGGPFIALDGLQDGTEYFDTGLINSRKYQYKVQAVTMYEKGQVGGGTSTPVEAVPVDLTPPPSPTGVTGIRTAAGVKIIWNPVQDSDAKGYRVYRRLPDEQKPVLIGEVKVPVTIFDDQAPPDARKWYYSVSTIDNASPANESPTSPEVEVIN
ncbi:MAG: fibronectin type III domain-containing protein [Desulfobulbales bacterium]